MGKVVYVTGAPASGKSSTTKMLSDVVDDVLVWEYGARLTTHLQQGGIDLADQVELRAKSARLAIAGAVDELDGQLLEYVRIWRASHHVLIDSHPVTREDYGFRITAFSHERFRKLAPDEIWCFFCDPAVAIERIRSDPAGRPMIDVETARMHTFLQGAVAATYGIAAGCPVYMFDTDRDQIGIADELAVRLQG